MENKKENNCQHHRYSEWMIGWGPFVDKKGKTHYHDPNRKRCLDCGYIWFRPCPTCGEVDGK